MNNWVPIKANLTVRGRQALDLIDAKFGIIIAVMSILAIFTFGAVTWVDARSYIDVARELHSLEALRTFFVDSRIWYHNYVPLGVPVQWVLLEHLPTAWMWPVVAICQRLVAAFALVFLIRSLQMVFPSRLIPFAGFILALHPFYQAFQNAFLTEPMAMCLMMIGVGLAVRRVYGPPQQRLRWFAALMLVLALAMLFRANVALMLICVALAVLFHLGKLLRPAALVPVGVFLVMLLAYPVFVSRVTGELILPRTGLSALVEAIRINPEPSPNAVAAASAELPPGEFDKLFAAGPDWSAAYSLALLLQKTGLSNTELMDRVEAAGAALRADTWTVELRAWLVAGGAIGLPLDCLFAPSSYFSMRDMPVGEYCRLYHAWYDYHTWTGIRTEIHAVFMKDFFTVEGRNDLQTYRDAWSPYVHEHVIFLRDPLFMRYIPLPLVTMTFLISAGLLLTRLPWLGLMFLGVFVGNWIIYASVPFGGARYVYPLFPLYIMAIPLAYLAWRQKAPQSPLQYLWEGILRNLAHKRPPAA